MPVGSLMFHRLAIVCVLAFSAQTLAAGVAQLSNQDALSGLKAALSRAAEMAVNQLGKPNGFLGDARVKIPPPQAMQAIDRTMHAFGMGSQADELVEAMNRAAEMAVVEARPILVGAVKSMRVGDAHGILTGADDAATQYFRRATAQDIAAKFLPIVKKATARTNLAGLYDRYAGRAAQFGLVDAKDAQLDTYVTQKAMDGLFLMIAEQEKAIRKGPLGTGSSIIGHVFSALK